MISALRKIWAAYLTAFVIACAITVGFTLGMIVHNGMSLTAISTLRQSTNSAILRRYGQ